MRSDVQLVPGPPSDPANNGAIAQLGERVLCKHEVVGSIPSGSTSRSSDAATMNGGNNQLQDMLPRHPRTRVSCKIIDIVKAGLAGLHDRLILIRHSRLIA